MQPDETTNFTKFSVEPSFSSHFRRLQQVFLYINDQCNLGCKQCIYKPHVTYHERREIPLPVILGLLASFHELGARKVTFLGGEPTLYGATKKHIPLRAVIEGARRIGYEYLRLDTNGQFDQSLFTAGALKDLDELAFSVDGFDSETNDLLRGEGTFDRATTRIRNAVALGIRASITCCIHRMLIRRLPTGELGVERVIRLGEDLGIDTVNFHDLFKTGVPMDTWTGSFDTSVEEHVLMYSEIRPKIENGFFRVKVRLPQCFVTKKEFQANPAYYGYCPVKLGERVMVHSDGVIRICSNLICSSFGTGRYEGNTIKWDHSPANEILRHNLTAYTPCTNRSKNKKYGPYVPLCFSFKPNQEEFVWRDRLEWDSRRTVAMVPENPECRERTQSPLAFADGPSDRPIDN